MRRCACPSCAGEIAWKSKITLHLVCPWCGSLVLRKGFDVEKVDATGVLRDDGSPIRPGTTGSFGGRRFEVIGRLQVAVEEGLRNEWYLQLDGGREGWLGERPGSCTIRFPTKGTETLPAFEELEVGRTLQLAGVLFELRELETLRVVWGEGELPFHLRPGRETKAALLATPDARIATLDYGEDPPLLLVGAQVDFDELRLSGLRALGGE
jgi:hypothetical protein